MNIHFLHINDVHSRLENYMRLAYQLRSLRNQLRSAGEPVFTLDIGDLLDRVRPETEVTMGRLNAKMMAALGVDAFVFGNNEGLTISSQHWQELVSASNAITFGTNLRDRSHQPYAFFHDTCIFEVENVRVGMFGLTPNYDKPYEVLDVIPLEPISQAVQAVDELLGKGADIIVCLSHLGLNEDYQLAEKVPHIDLILGGHTHHFMRSQEYVNGTAIFQQGKHALAFGHTVVEFDRIKRKVISISGSPVSTNIHGPLDKPVHAVYQSFLPTVKASLEQFIVQIPTPVAVVYDDESVFANALVDALFRTFPCDAGIMMAGALTASLLPGTVTVEDILAACSTPTRPIVLNLRGSTIYDMIHQGIQVTSYLQEGIGYGFRGSVIGYLTLANMDVYLTPDKTDIQKILVGGQELDRNRHYRIVTCEFLWLSSVFPMVQNVTDVTFYPPLVREVFMNELANSSWLEQATQRRYH